MNVLLNGCCHYLILPYLVCCLILVPTIIFIVIILVTVPVFLLPVRNLNSDETINSEIKNSAARLGNDSN